MTNPPLTIASLNGAGGQIGTGVNASSRSRAPATVPGHGRPHPELPIAANASTEQSYLNQVQSALDEPSSSGIAIAAVDVLERLEHARQQPNEHRRQAGGRRRRHSRADAVNQLSQRLSSVQAQATSQYSTTHRKPAARSRTTPTRSRSSTRRSRGPGRRARTRTSWRISAARRSTTSRRSRTSRSPTTATAR